MRKSRAKRFEFGAPEIDATHGRLVFYPITHVVTYSAKHARFVHNLTTIYGGFHVCTSHANSELRLTRAEFAHMLEYLAKQIRNRPPVRRKKNGN